jgi:hypothetical protein
MCDYSLYTIQNRLAQQGEELVLHKFETGTLGFASVSDLDLKATTEIKPSGFCSSFIRWVSPERPPKFPAVCIPPGSRLLLMDVPRTMQASLRVKCSEVVTFTELSDRSYSYRDALVLPNGTRVLLLSMSPEPSVKSADSEMYAA